MFGLFKKKQTPFVNAKKPSLLSRLRRTTPKMRKYEVEVEINYKGRSLARQKFTTESYSSRRVRKDFENHLDFKVCRIKNL